jgi:hypothetical protein
LSRFYSSALAPAPNGSFQADRVLTNKRNQRGIAMNQSIFQRRAILDGLRERNAIATTEFYQKVGIDEPVRPVRFNVVPRGDNMFAVVERSTGHTKVSCSGHGDACRLAQHLEDAPVPAPTASKRSPSNNFAAHMMMWTVFFCVVLIALAVRMHR